MVVRTAEYVFASDAKTLSDSLSQQQLVSGAVTGLTRVAHMLGYRYRFSRMRLFQDVYSG